jgi:zinc transport system substrate-binding protein
VRRQAETIHDCLARLDPGHREAYREGLERFLAEVEALHEELRALFRGKEGAAFMVFHPSWGYFARTYGLHQVPVEVEGKSPKPAQLADFIRQARELDIRVIFVQPQFSTRSAETIARAIDGRVVVADPLAENWAENLRRFARQVAGVLNRQ